MSEYYYIANKKNKTYYALGKSYLWSNLKEDADVFSDLDYLRIFILEKCFYRSRYSDVEWEEIQKLVNDQVAPTLYYMFHDTDQSQIEFFSDSTDDLYMVRVKRYVGIGTNMYKKGTKEYVAELSRLNRHLSNDPVSVRHYNIDNAKKYPEYLKY